jgi:hypothetical protein
MAIEISKSFKRSLSSSSEESDKTIVHSASKRSSSSSIPSSIHTLEQRDNDNLDSLFSRYLSSYQDQIQFNQNSKNNNDQTSFHYPQRQFCLSMIEFLTICCSEGRSELSDLPTKKMVLIYVGDESDMNELTWLHLSSMFPFVYFVLYNRPNDRLNGIKKKMNHGKFRIKEEIFTNETALEELSEMNTIHHIRLFVSNLKLKNETPKGKHSVFIFKLIFTSIILKFCQV